MLIFCILTHCSELVPVHSEVSSICYNVEYTEAVVRVILAGSLVTGAV